jgi:hypothetical protein
MSLPVGTWSITTDTLGAGTVTIGSVDASGNIAGSTNILSREGIVGFYDAGAQTVSLSNVNVAEPELTFIVFSAALFQVTSGTPPTTSETTDSVLAGTYESYQPPGTPASAGRWVASISQKVKEKEKEAAKDAKDHKDLKDHKEGKEGKEAAIKEQIKEQLPETLPLSPASDPAGMVQQLALRVDALEQRLAAGQAFIGAEERPDVGNQTVQGSGDQ